MALVGTPAIRTVTTGNDRAGVVPRPYGVIARAAPLARIRDFGVAHLEGPASMTATGEMLGTPAYMSPEQAAAKRQRVDHRTDIYSLGATLYEMLTLRPPFAGESAPQVCSQIASRESRSSA